MNRAKILTTTTGMLLISALAGAKPASFSERRLFCAEISKALSAESADMALDERNCPVNRFISITENSDKTKTLRGKVRFNAPNRPSFELQCSLILASNGPVESSLTCQE